MATAYPLERGSCPSSAVSTEAEHPTWSSVARVLTPPKASDDPYNEEKIRFESADDDCLSTTQPPSFAAYTVRLGL